MQVMVTNGAIRRAMLQSKCLPPTNQHPVFYRPDAFAIAQPTVSKHWRECNTDKIIDRNLHEKWRRWSHPTYFYILKICPMPCL